MKKSTYIFLACLLFMVMVVTNEVIATNNYNPEKITYIKSTDEFYENEINKIIDEILEKYDNKVYVKKYSSFDELKSYLVKTDEKGEKFYDPEITDRYISFCMAYRLNDSNVFESIFVDCEQ